MIVTAFTLTLLPVVVTLILSIVMEKLVFVQKLFFILYKRFAMKLKFVYMFQRTQKQKSNKKDCILLTNFDCALVVFLTMQKSVDF